MCVDVVVLIVTLVKSCILQSPEVLMLIAGFISLTWLANVKEPECVWHIRQQPHSVHLQVQTLQQRPSILT